MNKYSFSFTKFCILLLMPISVLTLSACSMNPIEGSASQYTSQVDRSSHKLGEFDVRSVSQAPEQIVLMFRIDVEPTAAFHLVSEVDQLATWFTGIENPGMDNSRSDRGPDAMGVNSVRSCSLEGDYLYEDIVHYDTDNLSYAYSIDMEKSTVSFPISNQVSMFTVESDGSGGSLITWRHYYDKNFHIAYPVITYAMKSMILKPAVETLFDQHGGEWVTPHEA